MKKAGKTAIRIVSVLFAAAALVGVYTMKGDKSFDDMSVASKSVSETYDTAQSLDTSFEALKTETDSDTQSSSNSDSDSDKNKNKNKDSDSDKNTNTNTNSDKDSDGKGDKKNSDSDTENKSEKKAGGTDTDTDTNVNNENTNADISNAVFPYRGMWNLIVVNRNNPIPEGYDFTLVELDNGKQVDERIFDDLQEMFEAARNDGVYPVVGEAYRTAEEQENIMQSYISGYIASGYSREQAQAEAENWVAIPGTSEHQLGLALDINADVDHSSNEDVYAWLAGNAYKYGFILRYPQGKESITGIDYEPWHYRYVGKVSAEIIYNSGECLEEFLFDD